MRLFRIFTNDLLRSSSSVRPLLSTASCSVIAPQFIALADGALYEAKEAGRNRIVACPES